MSGGEMRERLNYRGHSVIHIKREDGCQAGYFDITLCGKRIMTSSGMQGFGILWRKGISEMKKPMCRKCNFLKRKKKNTIYDYNLGYKKYPKEVLKKKPK